MIDTTKVGNIVDVFIGIENVEVRNEDVQNSMRTAALKCFTELYKKGMLVWTSNQLIKFCRKILNLKLLISNEKKIQVASIEFFEEMFKHEEFCPALMQSLFKDGFSAQIDQVEDTSLLEKLNELEINI